MPTWKIYSNTLAQIGAKILTALISIAMIKVLTNYLDLAGYGLYSKVYNYLSIFAVIADLGLYTIAIRELTKYKDDRYMIEKISGNILSLRTISGILIIGISLGLAPFLSGYNNQTAYIAIGIAGFFTLAGLMNSSIMSYLQATLRTEFSLVANTSGKLLTFGLIVLFASVLYPLGSDITNQGKIILVMLAGLAGNILMTSLTWWYASKYQTIRFLWNSDYIYHIIRISFPYGVALFLNTIFFKIDTILLSIIEPIERADIAIALYSVPMKLVEVGMMYGTIFLNSLLPVLTNSIEKKENKKTQKLIQHAFSILLIGGIGISIFLLTFAPWIIRIVSTQDFIDTSILGYNSVDALRIVCWIFLVYFLSSLYTYILIAHGEQKKMLYINACIALLNIVGNVICIPYYSFIGAAWITVITQIILLIITYFTVKKIMQ